MRYLLDTHILLWSLYEDSKLPRKAYQIINDPEHEIVYSAASIWEIEIKHVKSPDRMPVSGKDLAGCCDAAAMLPLSIRKEHVYELAGLSRREGSRLHQDPFDRILIAQAKAEGMYLLTHDALLADYAESCVIEV